MHKCEKKIIFDFIFEYNDGILIYYINKLTINRKLHKLNAYLSPIVTTKYQKTFHISS